MRRILCLLAMLAAPLPAVADPLARMVQDHALPRVQDFALATSDLAVLGCNDRGILAAYGAAFDAWVAMGHLRFGPTEAENRAFAVAFWPDPRNATPRALAGLLDSADPAVQDPQEFAQVSIAARGLYALEYLLFDPQLRATGTEAARCDLMRAITGDLARTAAAIAQDWTAHQAPAMLSPSAEGLYRSRDDVAREAFKALSTGLQFLSETRLGRPLGTFDHPRPERAEARRSGRSLRHVVLTLEATRDLAQILSSENPALQARLTAGFDRALALAGRIDSADLSGVGDPQRRLKVEILQAQVEALRTDVAQGLGASLGVSAGFNALDGD